MSDYLHNLVARHLNQIEVVQPRLASRFEPPSLMPSLGAQSPGGLERLDELEAQVEVEPTASESSFVSHRAGDSGAPTRPAAPDRQGILEPSTGNNFSSEPPGILAHGSDTRTKQRSDFAQKTGEHSSTIEEDPAQPVNELVPLTLTDVPDSPVHTPAHASSATLEEETLAPAVRPIRAEVDHTEKKSVSAPALQQRPERSDNSIRATLTDKPKLSPAHVPREIEIAAERREAQQQTDAATPNPTIPAPSVRHLENRHPSALTQTQAPEALVHENAPTPRPVEPPSQNTGPAGREKTDERNVERVLVERLLTAESRRIVKLTEVDSEPAKPVRPLESGAMVAQPQIIRYTQPKARARAEASSKRAEQPAPTINVTIGRIEVRAVAPDTSVKERRQSASQPRMSLSDYLHRRAGGGGR